MYRIHELDETLFRILFLSLSVFLWMIAYYILTFIATCTLQHCFIVRGVVRILILNHFDQKT